MKPRQNVKHPVSWCGSTTKAQCLSTNCRRINARERARLTLDVALMRFNSQSGPSTATFVALTRYGGLMLQDNGALFRAADFNLPGVLLAGRTSEFFRSFSASAIPRHPDHFSFNDRSRCGLPRYRQAELYGRCDDADRCAQNAVSTTTAAIQ